MQYPISPCLIMFLLSLGGEMRAARISHRITSRVIEWPMVGGRWSRLASFSLEVSLHYAELELGVPMGLCLHGNVSG